MESVPSRTFDDLDWLRQLARQLVRGADVDDVVQEAWLRAAHRTARSSVRGFLRRIVVNVARERHRAGARRRARERAAARGEAVDPTAEVVARYELQRLVVAAIGRLSEPLRRTVLLRFIDGLPPRVIAQRLGIPVKTVKSRLDRALARLRAELDENQGDRRGWVALLGPLARPALLGVLTMKFKLIAAGVALIALPLWVWSRGTPPEPASSNAVADDDSARTAVAVTTREPTSDRARLAAPEREPASRDHETVTGIVVDEHGGPVGGVRVGVDSTWPTDVAPEGSGDEPVSSFDGRFELVRGDWSLGARLVCLDDHRFTVMAPLATASGQPTIVVAPRRRLSGTVLDRVGVALEAVLVTCRLPPDVGDRIELDTSGSLLAPLPSVSTDAEGRFARQVPGVEGAELVFTRSGFLAATLPVPAYDDSTIVVTMRRDPGVELVVSGVVIDSEDRPVAGARVSLGGAAAARTGADGRFRFVTRDARRADRVVAVAAGYQPVEAAGVPLGDGRYSWPRAVELRLTKPALAVRGTVLDATGEPVPYALVWLARYGTLSTRDDGFRVLIEGVMSGSRLLWPKVEADAHGSFELPGLRPSEYQLVAMDPRSLALSLPHRVTAPASGVAVTVSAPLHASVRGRVVAANGDPLAGISVRAWRLTFENGGFEEYGRGPAVVTGADGRFSLESVPREGVFLRVADDSILARRIAVEPDASGALPVIAVQRRCRVRLALGLAERARLHVEDASGRPVESEVQSGNARALRVEHDVEGEMLNLTVPETAAAIVLARDGAVLRRLEVRPRIGEVVTVR